jgi:hypothetical protein
MGFFICEENMKISTNSKELKDLNACDSGYQVYYDVHGDKETNFSDCLKSNGWDDIWWLISEIHEQLSDDQKKDLRLPRS